MVTIEDNKMGAEVFARLVCLSETEFETALQALSRKHRSAFYQYTFGVDLTKFSIEELDSLAQQIEIVKSQMEVTHG